jgi:hypothetical protein
VLDFANCVYEHHAFKEKVHELAFVKTSLTGIAMDALTQRVNLYLALGGSPLLNFSIV